MSASESISTNQKSGAPVLGQKLRKAREELGLSIEDVCQAIKVQANAVRQMEAGDFEALGPSVFAKGFLRSYAKHVQLGQTWLDEELAALALDTTPTLLPSRGERHERFSTAERGMLAASYLVGTAILVSAIFVVTHFDRFVGTRSEQTSVQVSVPQAPSERTAVALEINPGTVVDKAPAVAGTAVMSGAPSILNPSLAGAPIVAAPYSQAIASPTPSAAQDTPSAVAAGLVALPNLPADSQAIELIASGTVWVEISDSTGRRLEFNNLSNGIRKSYSGKAPFTLKIGNAAYANLVAGGKTVDLSAFTNGNVAKLNLIETDGLLVARATTPAATAPANESQSPE